LDTTRAHVLHKARLFCYLLFFNNTGLRQRNTGRWVLFYQVLYRNFWRFVDVSMGDRLAWAKEFA
jgi:hypothetical protein